MLFSPEWRPVEGGMSIKELIKAEGFVSIPDYLEKMVDKLGKTK